MATELTAQGMEQYIRDYFDACNSGDAARIAGYFEPDGVHYFPPGMYEGPFRGAETIGRKWSEAVANLGSYWTVDQCICDPARRRAAIEWSHFKRRKGVLLRGDEWYIFSSRGLIKEIRAYYACPAAVPARTHELGDVPYAERGYPFKPPAVKRQG